MEHFEVGDVVILNHSLGIDNTLIGTRAKIIRKRINIFDDTEYLVKCVSDTYGVFKKWYAQSSWLIKIN